MRISSAQPWLHPLLLLLWTVLGLGLRLINLTDKPLWTDEFSTIVFSLGNSFLTIPLDQILTPEQLLQPLQFSNADIRDVLHHLLTESNHPPLYFVLAHLWLQLFPGPEGWVSVWGIRSFSAVAGALTIPAMFGLGWFAFRSRLVGQMAAVLMAVSPFGIYLAQEARHYTLPLWWIIASLGCLVAAVRAVRNRNPLPLWICLLWVVVNTLALATHYLTLLTLVAEAMVLIMMGLVQSWQEQGQWHPFAHWWRIIAVVAGTTVGALVWLPYLRDVPNSELTAWIQQDSRSGIEWLDPIAQVIAACISMLYLLPIQAPSLLVVIAAAVGLLLLVLWTLPKLYCGLTCGLAMQGDSRLSTMAFAGFVGSAIFLFFAITYVLERDLTSALRYNFVYFPGVIMLVAAALASIWTGEAALAAQSSIPKWLYGLAAARSRAVVLMVLMALLGSLTVVTNLGYQKIHRPDVVAQAIRTQSQGDVLIAIAHQTHGQTGRMMGIAWALQHADLKPSSSLAGSAATSGAGSRLVQPRFLLSRLSYDSNSVVRSLRQALSQYPRPLDLWLVNFRNAPEKPIAALLDRRQCQAKTDQLSTDGYQYRLYHCEQ